MTRKTKKRAPSKRRPSNAMVLHAKRTTKPKQHNLSHAKPRVARNPMHSLSGPIQIGVGAVLSQLTAGLVPFGGSAPIAIAIKAVAAGYLLEMAGNTLRPLKVATAQAKTGGVAAATITLLNAYVMPSLLGYVNRAIAPAAPAAPAAPGRPANGVNGIAVVQYPMVPGSRTVPTQIAVPGRGVNGINTAGYPLR